MLCCAVPQAGSGSPSSPATQGASSPASSSGASTPGAGAPGAQLSAKDLAKRMRANRKAMKANLNTMQAEIDRHERMVPEDDGDRSKQAVACAATDYASQWVKNVRERL